MAKWKKAVRASAEDILRNRGPIHEKVALDQAVDTAVPSYAFVSGWHFYAYLDIPTSQEECDDADDEHAIAQLYHAYTLAAKRVVAVFGDSAELLEHQGSLLHFHLRFDAQQANRVLEFGHLLATFVADDVMTHARIKLRFSMAAECGSCCILRVPSGLNEDSSYSRVSLGPCANNPAKALLGSDAVGAWKLAYRQKEDMPWQYDDCGADELSRELIRKAGFGRPVASKNFESVQAFAQDGIDPIEDVPYSTAKRIPGYVFRADLDGFTRKVHEKFSIEKILELKQQHPDAQVLVHPECPKPIRLIADKIGSTKALLDYSVASECNKFIVATESGIIYEMKKRCPDKEFIPAPPDDAGCACNECAYMKLITLEKLYNSLKYLAPAIEVDEEIRVKTVRPIERMLEISNRLGLIKK